MSRFFRIHPTNPQGRLIDQTVAVLRAGGVLVYPTDSCYALGCALDNKEGMDRIRRIRGLDDKHFFTLVCRDLSEIATYAMVDNLAYRLVRACTPGPYTFILKATHEVPKRLQHPRRKTVGLRVPDNRIAKEILTALAEPLISSSLILPGEETPMTDHEEMQKRLASTVDLIIDGGVSGIDLTTVVDLTQGTPVLIRRGRGDASAFVVK
jgi:tRNA threonylcarbamoyl adenosine modification protein (Sua5/YciO/YrdC/YwlC family)